MLSSRKIAPPIVALAALFAPAAYADTKTICTITVNSADEKEALRDRLPKGDYRFVELVEKGRADWLRSSCRKGVQCDALVISGHFNAGDTFYSDQIRAEEHLEVAELERAACSDSCPGVFASLKEVYLFGCESLNPDATKYSSSDGESGRDRMRRIFANVPVIYGFSSSAPVGPTAAMLLNRYFDGGGGPIATGRVNQKLLAIFRRNSMVAAPGAGDAQSDRRRRICAFHDERLAAAEKARFVHRMMKRDMGEALAFFPRIDRFFASLTEADRQSGAFAQALAEISADDATRSRYLAATRRAPQPAARARMIALAADLGWLSPEGRRTEMVALVNDVLAAPAMGYPEVDLVCSLNKGGELDGELPRVRAPLPGGAAHAAAMACLGSEEAQARIIRALASGDEKDAQAAQAYLRHRPMSDSSALRELARQIRRMPPSNAQVRALETLARLHVSDREILDELTRWFGAAKSVNVQRAIAEVFIRSDPTALPRREVASALREHRIRAPDGREDLIDVLLKRLQG